jgi:hypothetical protein
MRKGWTSFLHEHRLEDSLHTYPIIRFQKVIPESTERTIQASSPDMMVVWKVRAILDARSCQERLGPAICECSATDAVHWQLEM